MANPKSKSKSKVCFEGVMAALPTPVEDNGEIKVKTVDMGISQAMTLDLGGVHLQLLPMDSPHSRDAMLIYAPEEKATPTFGGFFAYCRMALTAAACASMQLRVSFDRAR